MNKAGLRRAQAMVAAVALYGACSGVLAQRVTLLAAGDIAQCDRYGAVHARAAGTAELVADYLARDPAAKVVVLGDVVYPDGSERDFSRCYHPTWGRFKERTLPSPGNHEYRTPGATGYFNYFGAAAGPGYYSLTRGSWRLISLDSNIKGAAMTAQLDWLRAELAAHPTRCTLAYWHHPLYSSGGHGSMTRMGPAWDILHKAGVELVLSGHDHDYERFAPQDGQGRRDATGMRQFVVGTGGAYLTPFLRLRPNSEMRDNSRFGVLKLDLDDGRYRWEFLESHYDGLPNGQSPDRGEGICH